MIDGGDPGDRLQPVLDLAFGEGRQLQRRVAVAVQRDPQIGWASASCLATIGFEDVVGQHAAHAGHAVAHVLGGQISISRTGRTRP